MKTILIIEDEIAYVNLLSDQLSAKGYTIIEAYDGKTGLETALREQPNLILLDIRLPKMDGLDVLHALRKDPWGRDANVIILTNLDDSKTISTAMHEIISKYVIKNETSLESVLDDIKIILKE